METREPFNVGWDTLSACQEDEYKGQHTSVFPSLFPFFSWLLQSILREAILYFLSKALVPRWFLRRRLWPLLMLIISLQSTRSRNRCFVLSSFYTYLWWGIDNEKYSLAPLVCTDWILSLLLFIYLCMCMWAFLIVSLAVCIITVFSCRENP